MRIKGCDTSHWQKVVNFTKMADAGAHFWCGKATSVNRSQVYYTDSFFRLNWANADLEPRIKKKAYHFANYMFPADVQARQFSDALGEFPGDLPPVLDYELYEPYGKPSPQRNLAWIHDFYEAWPRKEIPITLYTNPAMFTHHLPKPIPSWLLHKDLWVAHYLWQPALRTPTYKPWDRWTVWQFGTPAVGKDFGVGTLDLDMNYFNGSEADLEAFRVSRMSEAPPVVDIPIKEIDWVGIVTNLLEIETQVRELSSIANPSQLFSIQRIAESVGEIADIVLDE